MGGEGTVYLHPVLMSELLLAGQVCQKHSLKAACVEYKRHFELERLF